LLGGERDHAWHVSNSWSRNQRQSAAKEEEGKQGATEQVSSRECIRNRFSQVEAVKSKRLLMPSALDTFSGRATRSERGEEKRITNASFCAEGRFAVVLVPQEF
jgi:hypothetical protein